jgi:hypothetical protein
MKRQPELKIEVGEGGVIRIRGCYASAAQKVRLFAMTSRILPAVQRFDGELRKLKT